MASGPLFLPRRRWLQNSLLGSALAAAALPWTSTFGLEPHTDDDTPRPGRALQFPQDFGAHPGTRIEWWYATGSLQPAEGNGALFGFQITFFRSRTALADRRIQSPSRLTPRHLLFAHAAVTDVQGQRLLHAERVARWSGPAPASPAAPANPATGAHTAAQASLGDTDVNIGRWWLRRSGPVDRSVYQGQWADDNAGFGLSLTLRATQGVLLQGQQGYSRKSPVPGHASGYYSQPQLQVQGQLQIGGRIRDVQGKAWLDHEWSSALLDPEAVGWDWMGLNLDDGAALTVFRLRRADGSVLWAGGSWRVPGQPVQAFEPQQVRMQPGRLWRSPATDAAYPVEWEIHTPAGAHVLRALVDAQELDNRARTGTVYWEGISRLFDTRGRAVGSGYLEMTGYAGRLQL